MTSDERVAELERRVVALEKRHEDISMIEEEILKNARQFARLTKLGYYVERYPNGERREYPTAADARGLVDMFERRMKQAAEDLLRAETS